MRSRAGEFAARSVCLGFYSGHYEDTGCERALRVTASTTIRGEPELGPSQLVDELTVNAGVAPAAKRLFHFSSTRSAESKKSQPCRSASGHLHATPTRMMPLTQTLSESSASALGWLSWQRVVPEPLFAPATVLSHAVGPWTPSSADDSRAEHSDGTQTRLGRRRRLRPLSLGCQDPSSSS